MTTYKEINGTNIEAVSSDPANPVTGQVWYNTTTNVVKGASVTTAGAWSTGGNLNTGRQALGGAGIQTASLAFGGGPPPAPTATAITESYNGSAWTEVADLNSQRAYVGGFGTYTSAIAVGGDQYAGITESWNGSSWTELADIPGASYNASGTAGADNTSGISFGGGPIGIASYEWNGTSWTSAPALNQGRSALAGSGIKTAAIASGGGAGGGDTNYTNTEIWNGSTWTEVGDLNVGTRRCRGSGSSTSALNFGGNNPVKNGPLAATNESWNGTSWTEDGDLNTARNDASQGGGNQGGGNSLSITYGGGTPGDTAVTEEWTGAGSPLTVTFTDS